MSSHGTDDTRRSECDKFTNDVPGPPSLDFLLGILAIVPRPPRARDELHGGDGDAVDGGVGGGDGGSNGHVEVVVELRGCAPSSAARLNRSESSNSV
jgi:hypothetical protein